MKNYCIAVHGGASNSYEYSRSNDQESIQGIREALMAGYAILQKGKSALTAVEAAVMKLEDNPYFNAGQGSVLNSRGEVEMDASIMDGKNLKAGAVSMVRNVKNPVSLARHIMKKTRHIFVSGYGALELAKSFKIKLEPSEYFITEDQLQRYHQLIKQNNKQNENLLKQHGTVGAVAKDSKGNLAAATSTGGTSNCLPGRVGDSCIIGAGCYANNQTCAVSGTGEGEILISRVVAHTISMLVELKGCSIQQACDEVIHKKFKLPKGDMGVIGIDKQGVIAIAYNTHYMRHGYIDLDGNMEIAIT